MCTGCTECTVKYCRAWCLLGWLRLGRRHRWTTSHLWHPPSRCIAHSEKHTYTGITTIATLHQPLSGVWCWPTQHSSQLKRHYLVVWGVAVCPHSVGELCLQHTKSLQALNDPSCNTLLSNVHHRLMLHTTTTFLLLLLLLDKCWLRPCPCLELWHRVAHKDCLWRLRSHRQKTQ